MSNSVMSGSSTLLPALTSSLASATLPPKSSSPSPGTSGAAVALDGRQCLMTAWCSAFRPLSSLADAAAEPSGSAASSSSATAAASSGSASCAASMSAVSAAEPLAAAASGEEERREEKEALNSEKGTGEALNVYLGGWWQGGAG
jgi:hypothetical protein